MHETMPDQSQTDEQEIFREQDYSSLILDVLEIPTEHEGRSYLDANILGCLSESEQERVLDALYGNNQNISAALISYANEIVSVPTTDIHAGIAMANKTLEDIREELNSNTEFENLIQQRLKEGFFEVDDDALASIFEYLQEQPTQLDRLSSLITDGDKLGAGTIIDQAMEEISAKEELAREETAGESVRKENGDAETQLRQMYNAGNISVGSELFEDILKYLLSHPDEIQPFIEASLDKNGLVGEAAVDEIIDKI